MGNTFSLIVLLATLPVGLLVASRYGFSKSYFGCVFFAHLFLPNVSVDVPLFIPVGKKELIGIFSIITLMVLRKKLSIKGKYIGIIFFIAIVSSFLLSTALNGDTVFKSGAFYRGLSLYDGFAASFKWTVSLSPYLVGLLIFNKEQHVEQVLKWLVFFGITYAVLIMYEARMSPQLHRDIYGFFQHSFFQHIRGGGFRPIVFMSHGLHVAFFAMFSLCAMLILLRSRLVVSNVMTKSKIAFLGAAVIVCKSLGSIFFAIFAVPLLWLGSRRMIATVALALALSAMAYPMMRSTNLFPTDQILAFANSIDPVRAKSLGFRFRNEDVLLVHAFDRPILGWGVNGRNMVVTETGKSAIFDGFWIILLGSRGWFGFLATFGIVFVPIYLVWRLGSAPEVPFTVIGASLLLAINMVEWLPNTTFGPWTWILAGSLTGYALSVRQRISKEEPPQVPLSSGHRRRTVI